MRMRNNKTGDILEVPPPDMLGAGVVRFNGRVVENVLYSDAIDTVTLGNGVTFHSGDGFARYLVDKLEDGSYCAQAPHV